MRSMAACLLAFGCGVAATASPEPAWRECAPLPVGLAGFLAVATEQGTIRVAGGTRWEDNRKIVERTSLTYTLSSGEWRRDEAPLPRPFSFGAGAALTEGIVLLGGDDGTQTRDDGFGMDGARFDALRLPWPLAYAGSARMEHRIFILGGTRDTRVLSRMQADLLRLDLRSGESAVVSRHPAGPLIHPACVVVGSDLYAFGGATWHAGRGELANLRAAMRYSPVRDEWQSLESLPQALRAAAVVALDDRHVLLVGGFSDRGITVDCLIYDVAADRFRRGPALPRPLMLAGAVRHGQEVFVLGGEDAPRSRSAAMYSMEIEPLLRAATPVR
jgi:hypothetical protein